jgi:hypothetical protein
MISNILLVDDHPAILSGYLSVLNFNERDIELKPTFCHNCEDAFNTITKPENANFFDFIFLDRSLPAFPKMKLKYGEDLAIFTYSSETVHPIPVQSEQFLMLFSFGKIS